MYVWDSKLALGSGNSALIPSLKPNGTKDQSKTYRNNQKLTQKKAQPKEKCFPTINGLEQLRNKFWMIRIRIEQTKTTQTICKQKILEQEKTLKSYRLK